MKLDIGEPVISSHLFYALPLAIIAGDSRLQPWLYSEFIQWHTFRDRVDERMHMRVYNNKNEMFIYEPLHGTVYTPKQIVDENHIVETFKSILLDNQYIYDFVDIYYISSDPRKEHCMHDLLLYGFDDNSKSFCAFAYQRGKLVKFDIPYSDYEAAYNSDFQKEQYHCTVLYRKKSENFHTNINRISNHILDYLGSVNTYNREFPLQVDIYKPKFGLNVYDELKYNLRYMHDWRLQIDIPDLFCVYNHKRFMYNRVIYLNDYTLVKCPDNLRKMFAQIEEAGKIMLMLVMKINQKGFSSEKDYISLIRRLEIMKDFEEFALTEYYEYNRSVFEDA